MRFEKILVATDFSPGSNKALKVAISLARSVGAKICLCTALGAPDENCMVGGSYRPHLDLCQEKESAKSRLEDYAKEIGISDLLVECKVLSHRPSDEVPKLAKSLGCDLIVVGTHGHSGFKHFFLGSVAERVIRNSLVPVLVIPGRE